MTFPLDKDKLLFGGAAAFFILTAAVAVLFDLFLLIAAPFLLLFFYFGWLNKIVVFWVLLFSLPFSIEYQFSSSLGTDFPDELLMVFVSFLFLAAWLYSPGVLPKKISSHPLIWLLLISVAWTALAVCFSTDPPVSIKYLLAKSWYLGAFVLAPLILFRERKNILFAPLLLVSPVLLVTVIVLFRHSATGFSFESVNEAVIPFFRNHVNYSAMLACIIPAIFAILQFSKSKRAKVLMLLGLTIALLALFFSYARGAWLALLVGILAGWLIKKKWLFISYLLAIVIGTTSLFWIKNNDRYLLYAPDYQTTVFHKDFGQHLVATYKLKDVSTAERFYRWIAGIRMIRDNWLTGYGPNTFYDHYKGYAVPAYKTWVSDNKDHSTVHNYFLLTAIGQGLPGLFFLLILLGGIIFYAERSYHQLKDPLYRTIAWTCGVIICMIITLNFLSDLIETDKIGSLFFLCISFLLAADLNGRSDPSPDIQRIP